MGIAERVKEIIDSEIRPTLRMDGGDIELISVDEDGTVHVRLTGACGSCPFSTFTLKMGVEQSLKQLVPEVKEVVAE